MTHEARKAHELIGLGYCGLDYCCLVPHIPLDDKVEAGAVLIQGGGPAATAVCAASRLGTRVAFAGVVGDDPRGEEIVRGLQGMGVDTRAVLRRADGVSPAAFCWTDTGKGERSIVWTRGTCAPLTPAEFSPELLRGARLLHLDGHQTGAALRAAELARQAGVTVMLDAGTIVNDMERLLPLCDIIIASEKFAERFTGLPNPQDSLRRLLHANCRFAAVTLGERGSIGYDGTGFFNQPAFSIQTIDTTGAGDVFHGAFAHRYLWGGDWADCLRFSAAVAALKCTKFGGRTGIPTLHETETFLAEHGK